MPDKTKDELIEKYREYNKPQREFVPKNYNKDFEQAYSGKGEYFKIKDLKYNLRHGLVYPKSVIDDLVKASYKEGVDPVDALATMMRESGDNTSIRESDLEFTPKQLFSSWSNPYINEPVFTDYLMSKYPYGKKGSGGYEFQENDYVNSKDLKNIDRDYAAYYNKLNNWRTEAEKLEPFQAEVRWMKKLGNRYNPGEENRQEKLAKEKEIIQNNPDLHNYIQNKYNDLKITDERKQETPMQPLESIPAKPVTSRNFSKVVPVYNANTQKKTERGIVLTDPGWKFYKVYEGGEREEIGENEYQYMKRYNNAPPEIKNQINK